MWFVDTKNGYSIDLSLVKYFRLTKDLRKKKSDIRFDFIDGKIYTHHCDNEEQAQASFEKVGAMLKGDTIR